MTLVVKTNGNPLAFAGSVRDAVRAIDRNLPVSDIRTMDDVAASALAQPRFVTFLLGIFSSVALLMAAIGVYGLLHYSIARRGQEIGVRVALGARSSDVVRMILREGLALAMPGIALGLLGALWVSESIRTLLYRVSPTDSVSIAITGLTLLGATLLASYLPARRAARVDPIRALRGD